MDVGSMEAALWAQFPRRTTLIWMLPHSCAIEQFARARFEHFDRRSPGHATPRESDRRSRDCGILTEERRAVKSGARSRCHAPHRQGIKTKASNQRASKLRRATITRTRRTHLSLHVDRDPESSQAPPQRLRKVPQAMRRFE